MIANLTGRVTDIRSDQVIIEVGSVGLFVFVPEPLRQTLQAGETTSLHTYLAVREDSLTLYGFASAEEREYFILLIGVNGVGPRIGLATLSALNPGAIRRAVVSEQPEILTRVPGIGSKSAQRILLHLQGKIESSNELEAIADFADADTQVVEALVALGYSVVEAQAAVQNIPKDAPDDVEERIRLALQYFA
ncbi:MAG: Holliday junction branch migration protein RuvA [Anaerolineales bacterium]|nr:Holliday junction branch migration protein RuvA [Chloroflexota bacterium]MBL6982231.1 Holliday junction branch migration protein RuvA [Anaerolineales bacterium]